MYFGVSLTRQALEKQVGDHTLRSRETFCIPVRDGAEYGDRLKIKMIYILLIIFLDSLSGKALENIKSTLGEGIH